VEAVRRGEIWFYEHCSLCHMERVTKHTVYKPLRPKLDGLFKNATLEQEKDLREFIKVGTLRMPGFRYTFNDEEFEELIAYLKSL
jgi:mono/diheme cytochrome c family protein